MPIYDPSNARICLFIQREAGTLLSSMGHDLELRVDDFSIDVDLDEGEVSATIDANSVEPVDAIKWEARERTEELSDGDRHEIKQRMSKKVLETDEFPDIEFESTRVESTDDGWTIEGVLDLHGRKHEIGFDAVRDDGKARVETTIDHTEFGIEPYSAMMGALKVAPEVIIVVEVPLEI